MSMYAKAVELYEPPKPPTSSDLNINLSHLATLIKWIVEETNKRRVPEPCSFANLDYKEEKERADFRNTSVNESIDCYTNVVYWIVYMIKQDNPNFNKDSFYKECGL